MTTSRATAEKRSGMTTEVLSAQGITKRYRMPSGTEFTMTCDALSLRRGEMVVLRGHSGSGKSTLLQILGLLMTPDEGALSILGEDVSRLTAARSADFRRRHLGIVFQAFNLLPQLTAEQNVALPFRGRHAAARTRAREALDGVGLAERWENLPGEMSGGEQQRVAFARAVINDPDILLADEPTGNLDAETEQRLLGLFRDWVAVGRSALVVSHSDEVASYADRVVAMSAGRLTPEVV